MEIHRCRFVEFMPSTINCMAFNSDSTLLAVGRENSSIEIWNVRKNWVIEKIIPGGTLSVQSIAWGKNDRLFSAGLHSTITEWDLTKLTPIIVTDSLGGAVWSIAIDDNGTTLAAGCEDGSVRLFDISENNNIVYKKTLIGDKARILSVSWQRSSNNLVTGSTHGVIRKWNVTTGRPTHRMTAESQKGEVTIVWSVIAFADGTIVSGDSLGKVSFWDGQLGTLIESLSSHSSDILTMVANKEENMVFATGIDSQIVQFQNLPDVGKWIISSKNRSHTHDVKSLAYSPNGDIMVSGGVDANINVFTISKFPKQDNELSSFPQQPPVTLSRQHKILCCQFSRKIELWKLGKSSTRYHQNPNELGLEEREKKLLDYHINKNAENIVCSSISENGKWLALSDTKKFRLFEIQMREDEVILTKVKEIPGVKPAYKIVISPNSRKIIIANYDSTLQIIDVTFPKNIRLIKTFSQHETISNDKKGFEFALYSNLVVSPNSKWLATGDILNRINIYDLDSLKHHSFLPILHSQHSTFAFHPTFPLLIIASVSHEVFIYDYLENGFSKKYPNSKMQLQPRQQRHKILGISFQSGDPFKVMLYGLTYIYTLDLELISQAKDKEVSKGTKKQKIDKKEQKNDNQPADVKMKEKEEKDMMEVDQKRKKHDHTINFRYNPILYFGFLQPNSYVVIERPWISISQKLPPPLNRPRYGT